MRFEVMVRPVAIVMMSDDLRAVCLVLAMATLLMELMKIDG